MDDFTTLIRANMSNEEWIGVILLGKMAGDKISDEEKEYIVKYLISKNDHVVIRILELLNLVDVKGDLNVNIEQIKEFRFNMIKSVPKYFDDAIVDDTLFKNALAPINKEIRKYLKFWNKTELENEILLTETFEQAMNKIINPKANNNIPTMKKLMDCQGEHICKKTILEFNKE